MTDIGEYIVGAYLQEVKGCEYVNYSVRFPGGGIEGLSELDVIGFNFSGKSVFMCEVTTHIGGTNYGNTGKTITKITQKYNTQKRYAGKYLTPSFTQLHYMFWSPYVPDGLITSGLGSISGLELVINKEYTKAIEELRQKAKKASYQTGNPAFRMFQIIERLR